MISTSSFQGRYLTWFQLGACLVAVPCLCFLPLTLFVKLIGVISITAIAVVCILTPTVMWLAHRLNAMDYPGGRRIHMAPTPRWGGIAVCVGVLTALVVASASYMPNVRGLILGSVLVMLTGVWDDWKPVRASVKLLIQFGACAILILDGVHVMFMPHNAWGMVGYWLITALWIIGITNAVNFLDGMDGLVSGLSMGTALTYFILAILLGNNMLAYCSAALGAAAFAFLGFNVRPAKIFLGDSGSTFLGFFLATLSVQGSWAHNNPLVSFFIPILVLSVPIYDMVFITVERVLSGKVCSFKTWIEYTGKDHLHHRLEALGLSRGEVVTVICFLNLAVGFSAIVLIHAGTFNGIVLLVQACCIYAIFALLEVLGGRKARAALTGGNGPAKTDGPGLAV